MGLDLTTERCWCEPAAIALRLAPDALPVLISAEVAEDLLLQLPEALAEHYALREAQSITGRMAELSEPPDARPTERDIYVEIEGEEPINRSA